MENITANEVAKKLRISPQTARTLAAKKKLPAFKVGGSWRFRASEIEKLYNPISQKTS